MHKKQCWYLFVRLPYFPHWIQCYRKLVLMASCFCRPLVVLIAYFTLGYFIFIGRIPACPWQAISGISTTRPKPIFNSEGVFLQLCSHVGSLHSTLHSSSLLQFPADFHSQVYFRSHCKQRQLPAFIVQPKFSHVF